MRWEARPRHCWSRNYLLRCDERPAGEFEGRWFSEGIDVRLSAGRRLHLQKSGWIGSDFTFSDAVTGEAIGTAHRAGLFTSAWEMALSVGRAEMVSAGFFNAGYLVVQNHATLARVDRLGFCTPGWSVQAVPQLSDTDAILIGLIYHTILNRRNSNAAAAS